VDETEPDIVVVFGLLETLTRVSRSMYARALAPFGLNHAEWSALGRLRTAPSGSRVSQTDLRRLICQTSAGTTRVLDKLEEAGLVRREPDPKDGRALNVVLTAKGRRLADRSFGVVHAQQTQLLATFDVDGRTELVLVLARLLDALGDRPI
jgi:DNA-binding MarR family transcriptional regulator